MKKILSTIVAALAAISFAAVVFAEDVPYSEHREGVPAGEMRRDEPRRDEVRPMEKHHKLKKHHKKKRHEEHIKKEEQHEHYEH